MVTISQIMEHDAYYCHKTATVGDVLKILAEKKVSGVPVVDEQMKVVGFISDGDIMDFVSRKRTYMMDFHGMVTVGYGNDNFDSKLKDMLRLNVMELATTRVISVEADDDIVRVADILARKRIKKVPVIEDDKLVGVVSRSTIVRYMMQQMMQSAAE